MSSTQKVISTIREIKCHSSSKEKQNTSMSKIWDRLDYSGSILDIWRLIMVKYRMQEQVTQRWRGAHKKLYKNQGIICLEGRVQDGKQEKVSLASLHPDPRSFEFQKNKHDLYPSGSLDLVKIFRQGTKMTGVYVSKITLAGTYMTDGRQWILMER